MLLGRWRASGLLLLSVLASSSLFTNNVASAAKYAKICELRDSPPVALEYDGASGKFSLPLDTASDGNDGDVDVDEDVRTLTTEVRVGERYGGDFSSSFLRASRNQHRLTLDLNSDPSSPSSSSPPDPSNSKTSYIARRCPCDASGRTYCLVDGISGSVPDSCGVPWSDDLSHFSSNVTTILGAGSDNVVLFDTDNIGCFELNGQTVFIRNAWPVVVLWYGALLIFLVATSNGRLARAYMVRLVCPKLRTNERYADAVLAREDELQRRMREALASRAAGLRTRGVVRIPSDGGDGGLVARRREGMTEEEEREEATRWWIQQAERLGILSDVVGRREPQPRMEYVLRTRAFNAERERARRERLRAMKSEAKRLDVEETAATGDDDSERDSEGIGPPSSAAASTPTKRRTIGGEEGGHAPSTPETVATALSGDDDDRSTSSSQSPTEPNSAVAPDTAPSADDEEGKGPPVPNSQTVGITIAIGDRNNDDVRSVSSSSTPPPEPDGKAVIRDDTHVSAVDNDEEETFECTICLGEIDDGDRVGILPCTHVFHVDCLRQWITRRNACPLCQVTEIAAPRPVAAVEEEEESGAREELMMSAAALSPSENSGNSHHHLPHGDEEEGGNDDNINGAGDRTRQAATTTTRTTPWYMPAPFLPASEDGGSTPRRSPQSSRPSRLALSTTSSSSGDRGERRSSHHRHRGQRRRRRRSNDLW
mmetsp:Transcript_24642/g.59419  ORF Transcript_24642/g.59419 Transcript_24642/m.59419 type:complete len:711 (+) Transcript_24642:160-2292(+)